MFLQARLFSTEVERADYFNHHRLFGFFLYFLSFVRGTHTPRMAHSAGWGRRISYVWASTQGRQPVSPATVHIPLRGEWTLNGSSLPPFTAPPFTLHSAAPHPSLPPLCTLHSRPSLRRHSLFIPPLFTLHSRPSAPFTPALHCAALHPSFRRSSPFTPAPLHPSLPPFTAPPFTIHSAALHPSLAPLCTLHSRPSLSPFTAPPFTIHAAALHRSLCHRSLSPFTPPHRTQSPLTPPPSPALRCATLHTPFL
jgi:hypothetical protein